jgi:DNA-binding NtrC family response regulator
VDKAHCASATSSARYKVAMRLRIIDGPGTGTVVELGPEAIHIGRESGNDLRIEDAKSSRFHAEVSPEGSAWRLKDLGSSNGTWTAEGRIEHLDLADGVTFRIGRTWFRTEDEAATASDEAVVTGLDLRSGGSDLFTAAQRPPADLVRQNAYLVLLHRLIERCRTARGRDGLFEVLDDASAEVIEGDRVAVFLPEAGPTGWSLWPPHEVRLRARWGAVPFARTLLESARRRREPLLCTVRGDLDPSASMVRAGVKSAMAAPLRLGETVHALLYVDRVKGGHAFERADLEFLAAVANQLAATLANQERLADLTAQVERLTRTEAVRPLLLVGQSLAGIDQLLASAAGDPAPVLIHGPAGSGKELCARILHHRSPRTRAPLQMLSCAGMADDDLEVALFGAAAGSAPGVGEDRPGLWEMAHNATLLLDEPGELPEALQARLVQAIDRGEARRRGDGALRRADVRILAIANEAEDARLRPDLRARFAAWTLRLPALGERAGDFDELVDHILGEYALRVGEAPKRLAPEVRTRLMRAAWPGNVRQLRQTVERACAVATDQVVRAQDLPPLPGVPAGSAEATPAGLPIMALAEMERMHILRVLEHCGGNKKAAAEVLDIDRSTLYAKLRQYGV